ncbi:serine hydrolase domain-containing protein [Nonomuraea dietziae]|uniref:CubicO group peptidase (Beta-lactamase class C family) n=1 Tax=Nonomuraea dietziae TaxID=65515 RepID=A0A7W5YAL9_9ACTN|nr:serine hydrolase [Nonomuraea dietziae]MBB3727163.1 CubicO group peptidase (beta-lactamase class C family) [Nonomuraea dietziae]
MNPHEAGFAPDLADRLKAPAAELHGLVIMKDGRLVLEHYGKGEDHSWGISHGVVDFGPDTLHDLRSVTKSVVSLLYGIALADGLVPEPHEPLLAHFPEYPDLAADPRRAALRVEHALTMTLGLEWREDLPYTTPENSEIAMELAPDRHRFVLDRPIVATPGESWNYCGGASAILARLVVKGTGEPLPEFARRRLFEPLGITRFEWLAGDDGIHSAAAGLRLTPRDLAAIGQAVLEGGAGVIPSSWLEQALRPRVELGEGSAYGYQWWLGTGRPTTLSANGNGGQRLVLYPELGLVVAMTAGRYDDPDSWRAPQAVLDVLLEARTEA